MRHISLYFLNWILSSSHRNRLFVRIRRIVYVAVGIYSRWYYCRDLRYKITQFIIITGFLAQTFFVEVCQLVLLAPHPSFFHEQASYEFVLGLSLLRINISGFIAYIVANLANSYILTRWKVLLNWRYFWLRSLGSSTCSEILLFIHCNFNDGTCLNTL